MAKTPGRKRAGRHDDRGGHSRRRPVATPETVRIALRTAAGRTGAGGTFIPHPTAPTTASSAAGCTNTGGGSATISQHTRPTAPTTASPAAGCTNTGGGSTTIWNQPRPTAPTTASSAASCTNTGGGSATISQHTRPTAPTTASPAAGRNSGRTTGRGRGLSSPVPNALGSAPAAAGRRRLGSGGHSSARYVPIASLLRHHIV